MSTVLILGGLGGDGARHLISYLTNSTTKDSKIQPKLIRVVDKYLVIPQAEAFTCYVDAETRHALKQADRVEYMQGNLLTSAMRTRAMTLPEAHGGPSKGFDYVFDFTGEADFSLPGSVRHSRPGNSEAVADRSLPPPICELKPPSELGFSNRAQVQVERTLALALALGQSAVEHDVGVYVRLLATQYKVVGDKKAKVGEEGSIAEPWGVRAAWFHEAARGLASIKGLNLVLVRPALFYGSFTVTGLTPRMLIGEVYRFLGEKLEFLWKESLPLNTIWIEDFCSATIAIAAWALSQGSERSLALAGEDLPTTLTSDDIIQTVQGAAKKGDKVKAAVFTLADDGDTVQADIAKLIGETIGVEAGFHGSIISSFAKLNMGDVLEDVNEKHLEGWSELLQASKPPISSTVPISPYVPADLLEPHPIHFSNTKLVKLIGWTPTQKLDSVVLRDTVQKFLEEHNWPNAEPKSKSKKK
ncbi:BZ3500_MvSof-1268-A1-R1_Chr6-3g08727 [Microbotryum saponariae]|uniref:BZ3500_MvSof-1268-A1-R1_Chr6-3g08727 protein n=1 Tax=Microbotryum saponariae TaxID=289078 RepID=A0A2X0L469_9BASI|nr:BZ3500_MvSof-1268-A1-R1_Chr6-3g08727 [Microbotryum saponariae]SDA07328.1 BZ3501_MvSof-1269-A2-R1_Chr6-2g08430 [Microbotryum saponariae]